MDRGVLLLLVAHIAYVREAMPDATPLFIAPPSRRAGYDPNRRISVNTFRSQTRRALRECCGLSQADAKEFGTHSYRIGAIELLRVRGVPCELRQQLGGWMSRTAALGYLQLNPGAQFGLLQSL